MSAKLDPRIFGVALDSSVFDATDGVAMRVLQSIAKLVEAGEFRLLLPHGVLSELMHPNTPASLKALASGQIFTSAVPLNASESAQVMAIERILRGNARVGKHEADASHVFESNKYGTYLVIDDDRVLRKRSELRARAGVTVPIVSSSEMVTVLERFGLLTGT